ncbi:hypothetical protein O181_038430 [Austropuccinia psidii MF-1]|uniref:Uncharacterized protein n=1 Tax=Austropuccinia psidii MF-1 TaxID=1389203 RepID=A0A9Q3HE50_9BASI|nr:hypothetical protein [Austropuccinia psidii MF-1]
MNLSVVPSFSRFSSINASVILRTSLINQLSAPGQQFRLKRDLRLDRLEKICSYSYKASDQVPNWLKELEIRQTGRAKTSQEKNSESGNNGKGKQADDGEEVMIYVAKLKDNWRGSPTRVGLSLIGFMILSGYVAQQVRHYGAGPVWPDSKDWSWTNFELKPWSDWTRLVVSAGIITLSTYKSIGFILTLSHTVRRISFKLKQPLKNDHRHRRSFRQPAIDSNTKLTLYSIGSQDLFYPLNRLFPPLIIRPSELWCFGRLTDRMNVKAQKIGEKVVKGGLIPLKPIEGGLATQLPIDGTWGNFNHDLTPDQIKAMLEDSFEYLELKDPMIHYHIGFDPRQTIKFNINVLLSYLNHFRRKLSRN